MEKNKNKLKTCMDIIVHTYRPVNSKLAFGLFFFLINLKIEVVELVRRW